MGIYINLFKNINEKNNLFLKKKYGKFHNKYAKALNICINIK